MYNILYADFIVRPTLTLRTDSVPGSLYAQREPGIVLNNSLTRPVSSVEFSNRNTLLIWPLSHKVCWQNHSANDRLINFDQEVFVSSPSFHTWMRSGPDKLQFLIMLSCSLVSDNIHITLKNPSTRLQ